MGVLTAYKGMEPLSGQIEDYPDGIILPIDKPWRWTSADVIRKVKFAAVRHFHKKNLKVGHAGTLDPLATGVLLVCIGKATKLAEELQRHDKEYVAGVCFGATTPSYDLEKEIDRFYPWEHIDEAAVRAVLPGFLGEQEQVAPLFSAKSVDGVRAYELARKRYGEALRDGTDFDHDLAGLLSRQRIRIDEIELLSFTPGIAPAVPPESGSAPYPDALPEAVSFAPSARQTGSSVSRGGQTELSGQPVDREHLHPLTDEATSRKPGRNADNRIHVTDNSALGLPRADIRVACTKGTYIRALARDLGEAVGSGAHLDALRRTRSGGFRVEDVLSVEDALRLLS